MKNKVNNLITLSFDDSRKSVCRKGDRTIVKVRSYFKQENLDRLFNQLGYTTLPESVINALHKFGYKMDYKLGGWAAITSGVVLLDPNDVDDDVKAKNIASTKAKVKAYDKAYKFINSALSNFNDVVSLLMSSLSNIEYIGSDEYKALDRCMETGFCNPDHKTIY